MEQSITNLPTNHTERIRYLNAKFRKQIPDVEEFYATDALKETFAEDYDDLLEAIRNFTLDITNGDDVNGDHSDITFPFMGHNVRWEIQYFDKEYYREFIASGASWDDFDYYWAQGDSPEDPERTLRSILIDLA